MKSIIYFQACYILYSIYLLHMFIKTSGNVDLLFASNFYSHFYNVWIDVNRNNLNFHYTYALVVYKIYKIKIFLSTSEWQYSLDIFIHECGIFLKIYFFQRSKINFSLDCLWRKHYFCLMNSVIFQNNFCIVICWNYSIHT